MAALVQREALPRFAAWGLWHDGDAAKPDAVRPVAWILERAPELAERPPEGPQSGTRFHY